MTDLISRQDAIALLEGLLCNGDEDYDVGHDRAIGDAIEALTNMPSALPSHKASLSLTHNCHLDYYRTVKQEFENDEYYHPDSFPEGEREKCIAANELWTLHWYPDTPVGFCVIHASTLEAVLRAVAKDKP